MRIQLVVAGACAVVLGCSPARPPPRAPRPSPVHPGSPPTSERPRPLVLLTWNTERLGQGEKRLDLLARVIARADVAVLEEVMKPAAARALARRLPGFAAVVSPRPVGRNGYNEWYAVLYRKSRVRLVRAYEAADPDDRFYREPFIVCLDAARFDFCAVAIHIVYGHHVAERDAEIRALAALVSRLRAAGEEKDWIVLGDFNRPGRAPGWDALKRAGWRLSLGDGNLPTSIGRHGYASAYDHVVLDPRYTRELSGAPRRVDVIGRYCGARPNWCRRNLSDHAPVEATFRTSGPDDD